LVPGTHSGTGGSATIFASGNAGELEAETSKAFNVGLVWSPTFADLRVSVDYYTIEINDQIRQLGAANILSACYNSENFAIVNGVNQEPLCLLFTRNETGANRNVVTVQNNYINIAEQTTNGIDVAATYRRDFSFGTLTLDTSHTFQFEDELTLFPNSTPQDFIGEAGRPKWVADFSSTLDRGPWSFFWGVDFIGKTSNIDSYGGNTGTYLGNPVRFKLKTEDTVYHNISVARELPYDINVRVGVSNLFDEAPPAVTTLNLGEYNTVGTSAFYSQYDWLGRRFFVNMSKKF